MKIEHVALNVTDPVAMARWYVDHLGLTVVIAMDTQPFTHFLADDGGTVMLEIYNNPPDQVPDYPVMNPLLLHLAFVSPDPGADKNRLLAAGATEYSDQILDDGSHIVIVRDPWGLPVQLCKRATPMLG